MLCLFTIWLAAMRMYMASKVRIGDIVLLALAVLVFLSPIIKKEASTRMQTLDDKYQAALSAENADRQH